MRHWLLASARVRPWAALGLTVLLLTGCGGSKTPGGTSLAAQIEAAQRDPDPQSRARALITLGYQQYKAQDTMGARDTYRLAHRAANEIKIPGIRAIELAKLAEGYARMDNPGDARDVVREAKSVVASVSEPFLQVTAYSALAKAMGIAQDQGEAAALLRDAEAVVDRQPQTDDPIELQQRVDALISIAEGYYGLDRKDNAAALFDRIRQLAEAMPLPRSQANALASLGAAQNRLGAPEGQANLDAAVEAAHQIEDVNSQAHALAEIAVKLPSREQTNALLDEANKLAEQVPDAGLRNEVQEKIRKARR